MIQKLELIETEKEDTEKNNDDSPQNILPMRRTDITIVYYCTHDVRYFREKMNIGKIQNRLV